MEKQLVILLLMCNMTLQKVWEIYYKATKSTAAKSETVTGECITDAPSLLEAVQKFHKLNPDKRGQSYSIESISQFSIGYLK